MNVCKPGPFQMAILFFLLAAGQMGWAQETKVEVRASPNSGFDSTYIKRFPNRLVVRLINEYQLAEVGYQPSGLDELSYQTNNPENFGFGIDYKWISFEYTASTSLFPAEPQYGRTILNGFGLGLSSRKLWFKAFYQTNKGFYLDETEKWIPGYSKIGEAYKRPDLETRTFFSSLTYGFNSRKFSNSAALYQLEQQKKGAGSFCVGVTIAHNSYSADSSIVPQRNAKKFEFHLLESSRLLSMGLNVGYLHTFVWGDNSQWFCSLAIIPGILFQSGTLKLEAEKEKPVTSWTGGYAEGRLSIGYNSSRWLVGLGTRAFSMFSSANESNPLSITYTSGQLFLGYRIQLPETRNPLLKKVGL